MRKPLFIAVLLMFNLNLAIGQADESRNFIYFFSDSISYSRNIDLKTPFFADPYLLADSTKVNPILVKFYKSETGFYGNAMKLNGYSSANFYQRVRKGKINLFEKEVISTYTPSSGAGAASYSKKMYFNKGYENLKKATYKNLRSELSDNPNTLVYFKKYKRATNREIIFSVAGGAALITGIALIAKESKSSSNPEVDDSKNFAPGLISLGVGAGCLWTAFGIGINKTKHLSSAIDKYNE